MVRYLKNILVIFYHNGGIGIFLEFCNMTVEPFSSSMHIKIYIVLYVCHIRKKGEDDWKTHCRNQISRLATFVFFNDCVIHDQNAFTHNKCGECGGCNEVIYKIRSKRKRKEKKKILNEHGS